MPIRYKQGDLLKSDAQALVNTVNCVGVMGKGIAKSFKQRYPTMFARYREKCVRGEVYIAKPYMDSESGRIIINFPTKAHWRSPSNLQDIRVGLQELRTLLLEQSQIMSIAIPPVGCGNGGLHWQDVKRLIEETLSDLRISVEVYEPIAEEQAPIQGALFETVENHSIDGVH